MTKSEIIDLTLCFISIVGLIFNCYLFYKNTKKYTETKDHPILNYAFCNIGIVYGMLAFIFYMFSFIILSKETVDELHHQCLIYYILEGLFFLIAGVIKIVVTQWRIKYKSTECECSKCIHKKVCYITDNEKDIKSCKNFIENGRNKNENRY